MEHTTTTTMNRQLMFAVIKLMADRPTTHQKEPTI